MDAKTWTKDEIKENLVSSDKWLARGLLAIYDKQTVAEVNSYSTIENNSVGFDGLDAEILTSIAQQLRERGTMSYKQTTLVRKKMTKYAGQLAKIANGKIH